MPANTVRSFPVPVGTLLLPPNSYRVLLFYTTPNVNNDAILIGNDVANGITLLADLTAPVVIKFNEAGTAMQGPVYMLLSNSGTQFTITEITRVPKGFT